jgi:hemolysin activation/secretion protein
MAGILPDSSLGAESSGLTPPQINLNNQSADTKALILILSQIPNPITPRPPEQPTPIPQPLPDAPLEIPTPKLPSSEEQPNIPGTQTIKRFEFQGNTAFSNEELAEVTKPFTGEVTFAELLEAEAAVTNYYTNKGYINSGAVIPAGQNIQEQDGVVKMQIIEGGIEDIKVSVEGRLNPNYVRSRLAIASQTPLNRDRLLEALQLLQLDPLIQNISAELSAGSRPELSLLAVKVTEADSFNIELFTNNGRAPSVGSWRRGVRLNEGNLLGFGDRLSGEYTNTDGSNAFDGRYALPLNPRNGTLTLAGGLTDTEVVEPPFDRIDITGDSYYLELGFRQPIIQAPTQELALGLTVLFLDYDYNTNYLS